MEEGLEHGGDEVQGGDVELLDEGDEIAAVTVSVGPGEDEVRAGDERPEELPDGDVEAVGGLLQDAVGRVDGEGVLHPPQAIHESAVLVEHALGLSGRARGVDDISEVGGLVIEHRSVRGLAASQSGTAAASRDRTGMVSGRATDSCPCRCGWVSTSGAWASASMEGEPGRRQLGVQGQIGGAGLDDAEEGDDELDGPLHADADAWSRGRCPGCAGRGRAGLRGCAGRHS